MAGMGVGTGTRAEMPGVTITRDNLSELRIKGWRERKRKIIYTKMVRMNGPFRVQTREGTMECLDGYLAVDSNGDPYPIAKDVADATFEP